MSLEAFATSRALTLGVELELQIVNTHNFDLAPQAQDLMRLMKRRRTSGLSSSNLEETSMCFSEATSTVSPRAAYVSTTAENRISS